MASEEKYISDWMDKGFPPETVALAYDKTVFYKKQLEWRYLNGILRRWHENGWHTPEEVQQYVDGVVDPTDIVNDNSYTYRGLDESRLGDGLNTSPTHLGTSPRYHKK